MKAYSKVPVARSTVIRSRLLVCSTVEVVIRVPRWDLFPTMFVSIYAQYFSCAGQLSRRFSG